MGYGTEKIPLRMVQLGPQLYDGTAGIALFFAALARVEGEGDSRQWALDAIAPLRRKLGELASDAERAGRLRVPLGGLIGVGSFIYALLKIGELLDEPNLLREAHQATALITPERIAHDQQVRIQTGCAGAILALLALQEQLADSNSSGNAPLNIALQCAEHLLNTRISFEGRPRAWALSPGKPPLAGFSYGAAGICYALLRLYEQTLQQELLNTAQEGLAFVRGLYSQEHGSWQDIRMIFQSRYCPRVGTWKDWWASGTLDDLESVDSSFPPDVHFPEMWCHGSAGIALARIGALHLNDAPEIRHEIQSALDRARRYATNPASSLDAPDDLCCGHMGLIELLLSAQERLGDSDSGEAAHALMDRVQQRKQKRGRYDLSAARGSELFAPSLFQGIAGIGYTLLRLASPQSLPCLLLME